MSQQYMYLHTLDRDGGTNQNAEFIINGFSNIPPSFYLTLESLQVPHQMHAFSEQRLTTTAYFQISGDTNTTYEAGVTLQKLYTGNTFATELQSALNGVGGTGTWTVAFSSDTKRLTVTNADNTFRFVDGAFSIHREMGYDIEDDTFQAAATPFNFPATVDLTGTKYVDVLMSNAASSSYTSAGTYNVLVRVPVDVEFGGYCYFEPRLKHDVTARSGQFVRLELRDDRSLPVDLDFNGYVSYTFLITPI